MSAAVARNLVAEMAARIGVSEHEARVMAERAGHGKDPRTGHRVSASADLERILALPQRDWRAGLGGRHGTAEEMRTLLSIAFRRRDVDDNGRPVELRVQQAIALSELHDFGGAVCPIRVGGGKTLITLLAARVCPRRDGGRGALRPLLIVPAKLRDKKTRHEWREYAKNWVIPGLNIDGDLFGDHPEDMECGRVYVTSYERISRATGDQLFYDLRPDLVMADEAHKLANLKAASTRRVRRLKKGKIADMSGGRPEGEVKTIEIDPPAFMPLSGTLTKRSLGDFGHLCEWALGEGSPLPINRGALQEWASALDERLQARRQIGALARLVPAEETQDMLRDPLGVVRRAFGRRFASTPGVVSVADAGCQATLIVDALHFDPGCEEWAAAMSLCRDGWALPDGQDLADPMERWRCMRQLALGFFYRWVEQPPGEWRSARSTWAKFCRETISHARSPGRDSEAQVARLSLMAWRAECDHDFSAAATVRLCRLCGTRAGREAASECAHVFAPVDVSTCAECGVERDRAEKGRAARVDIDPAPYRSWSRIRPAFTPVTEAVWITRAVLERCVAWIRDAGNLGLTWCEHVEVGAALAKMSGAPFFGGGSDADLDAHRGPAILSLQACKEGFNLQRYRKNLVTSIPSSGRDCEQLLGRTHRDGQDADEVECEVLVTCIEHVETFFKARADGRYLKDTGHGPQKIVDCDIVFRAPDNVWSGYE